MKRETIIRNRLFKIGKSEFLSSKNFTKFIKKIRVGTKIKHTFSFIFLGSRYQSNERQKWKIFKK